MLLHLHTLEKRSLVKKVLAGIVNDPQHAVAARRGKHFIEPSERQIIRRELAKSLARQANHKPHSHSFILSFTLPMPCASYQ